MMQKISAMIVLVALAVGLAFVVPAQADIGVGMKFFGSAFGFEPFTFSLSDNIRVGSTLAFAESFGVLAGVEGVFYFNNTFDLDEGALNSATIGAGGGLEASFVSSRGYYGRSANMAVSALISGLASANVTTNDEGSTLDFYFKLDFGLQLGGRGYDEFRTTVGVMF